MLSPSDPTDFLAPHGNTSKIIISGYLKVLSPLFSSFLASNAEAVLGSTNQISLRDQGAAVPMFSASM